MYAACLDLSDGSHGAHEFGFNRNIITHLATRFELEDTSFHTKQLNLKNELITRLNWALKARAIDTSEVIHRIVIRGRTQSIK